MRKYEIMYILDQYTKDVKAVQQKLHDILAANGGKIVESADWGLKDFAYEINHKKKGYYTVAIVETTSENVNEFQRIAKIDKEVVRTLVLNTESEKRYVQTTALSKTDMSKFKEEKKPTRGFDKRRDDNRAPSREEGAAVPETSEAKPSAATETPAEAKQTTKTDETN